MKGFLSSIGKILRIIRKEKDMTQEKLAFQAGVHPTYIGQVERGEKNITITNLKAILDCLGISLSEFFFIYDNQQKNTTIYKINDVLNNMDSDEQELSLKVIENIQLYKSKK